MKELTFVLAIVMPLAACALNSWLNIKIKFAPDAEQAKRETRLALLRVLGWISNLYMVVILVWQFTWTVPLTRLSILAILIPLFTLFHSYVLWWIRQVLEIFQDQGKIMSLQAEAMKGQLELIRQVADAPPKA
jgi:hypothetical protein